MLVISSREFRQNQKEYFDRGEHIIVQRGKDKSYALTPVSEDDMYFSAEMVKRIKQSILEADKGEIQKVSTSEEIRELLSL